MRGDSQATGFVANINYDAKGQRTEISYRNGAITEYEYDEKTFRLTHLRTTRSSDGAKLQDLFYTYDPVGNITAIKDRAQKTVYFNNQVVTASAAFDYDAIYRLIKATGREHLGQTGNALNAPQQPTNDDGFRTNLPHPTDGQAMGNYTERYDYDEVGNILKMIHAALSGSWTRDYQYDPNSNRLLITSNPSGSLTDTYDHDAHGNMTRMPHLKAMQWNFRDQLQSVGLGGGGNAYYTYDSAGQRVRKVWEKQGGLVEERIYLGGYEIFRRRLNGNLELERETLHVMDDKRRIAMMETKTVDNGKAVSSPSSLLRYQFDNHLSSASLELDEQAQIISYEEYYPYGNTSYQAAAGNVDASPKRYRYTGKEKDEESGLYYHGARYYAVWLGRWLSADPAGQVDGNNLYVYADCNPIIFIDPSGYQHEKPRPLDQLPKIELKTQDVELGYMPILETTPIFILPEFVITANGPTPAPDTPSTVATNPWFAYMNAAKRSMINVVEPSTPYYMQDQTRLQGINNQIKFQIDKYNSALMAPFTVIPFGDSMESAQTSIGPPRTKSTYEQRFSELMTQEYQWREQHESKVMQKYYEAYPTIRSPYVAHQLDLLSDKSTFNRLFEPQSQLWGLLDALGGAKQVESPYGVSPEGMTSHMQRVPNTYNTTLVVKPGGQPKYEKTQQPNFNPVVRPNSQSSNPRFNTPSLGKFYNPFIGMPKSKFSSKPKN